MVHGSVFTRDATSIGIDAAGVKAAMLYNNSCALLHALLGFGLTEYLADCSNHQASAKRVSHEWLLSEMNDLSNASFAVAACVGIDASKAF